MKLINSITILLIIFVSVLFGETTSASLAAQLNETTDPQVRAKIINELKIQMKHLNEMQREATLSQIRNEIEKEHDKAQHGMESEKARFLGRESVNSEHEGDSSESDSGGSDSGGSDSGGDD